MTTYLHRHVEFELEEKGVAFSVWRFPMAVSTAAALVSGGLTLLEQVSVAASGGLAAAASALAFVAFTQRQTFEFHRTGARFRSRAAMGAIRYSSVDTEFPSAPRWVVLRLATERALWIVDGEGEILLRCTLAVNRARAIRQASRIGLFYGIPVDLLDGTLAGTASVVPLRVAMQLHRRTEVFVSREELREGRLRRWSEPLVTASDDVCVIEVGGENFSLHLLTAGEERLTAFEYGPRYGERSVSIAAMTLGPEWPECSLVIRRHFETHSLSFGGLLAAAPQSLPVDSTAPVAVGLAIEAMAGILMRRDPSLVQLGWMKTPVATFEVVDRFPEEVADASFGPFRGAASRPDARVLAQFACTWPKPKDAPPAQTAFADHVVLTADHLYVRDLHSRTVGRIPISSLRAVEPRPGGLALVFGRCTRVLLHGEPAPEFLKMLEELAPRA